MNAKTADGVVHALRGGVMDGGKRVACGLKGQQHALADKDRTLVQASPTNDDVTCLACISMGDADDNQPEVMPLAPSPWSLPPREKK